jgi:hypothetical protein
MERLANDFPWDGVSLPVPIATTRAEVDAVSVY